MKILKAAFLILLCFIYAPDSSAALRGTAQNALQGSSIPVTVSSIGIQANDVVIVFAAQGGGNTLTLPTGFSAISGLTSLSVNGNVSCIIGYKIATGSEPTSYTVTSNGNDFFAAQVRVYSGRNTSSPFTAQAQTASTALSGASPTSLAHTGVTAAAGDDISVYTCTDNSTVNSGNTYNFNAPSGWANAITAFLTGNNFAVPVGSADDTNAASGATGTITPTLTWTGSLPGADYGGYVVSLAAAAGGSCTHAGQPKSGAVPAVPNGTSGSYWGKSNWVTPDCSTVSYWQPAVGNFGVN